MIDSTTGKRLEVKIFENGEPYLEVPDWNDADFLEDELGDTYDIMYNYINREGFEGTIYVFGSVADPIKLQEIIDKVDLDV
jgi:hypothetical protein